MATAKRSSILQRLFGGAQAASDATALRELHRIQERRRKSAEATEQWASLLREMEDLGQSHEARYESYYQAYLQARQQEKRADLELFNIRQQLSA